jgi:hypothetical protein
VEQVVVPLGCAKRQKVLKERKREGFLAEEHKVGSRRRRRSI